MNLRDEIENIVEILEESVQESQSDSARVRKKGLENLSEFYSGRASGYEIAALMLRRVLENH